MSRKRNQRNKANAESPSSKPASPESEAGEETGSSSESDSQAKSKQQEPEPKQLPSQSDLQRHIESKLTNIRRSKRNLETELGRIESLKVELKKIGEEEVYLETQLNFAGNT